MLPNNSVSVPRRGSADGATVVYFTSSNLGFGVSVPRRGSADGATRSGEKSVAVAYNPFQSPEGVVLTVQRRQGLGNVFEFAVSVPRRGSADGATCRCRLYPYDGGGVSVPRRGSADGATGGRVWVMYLNCLFQSPEGVVLTVQRKLQHLARLSIPSFSPPKG